MADFAQTITTAYATDGAALDLGRGVHDGAVVTAATVKLPLRMVNRHGLIAGATGTGKTKTLQGIAEQLSSAERVDNQSAREILASRMARRLRKLTGPGRPSPFGPSRPRPAPPARPQHKEAAGAMAGGVAAVTSFLNSRQGKQLQKEVVRGVFGLLKKKR